jgi:hypothetical protein
VSLEPVAIAPADESAVVRDEFAAPVGPLPDFEHAVAVMRAAPATIATVITDFGKRNVMDSNGVALFCGSYPAGFTR